MRSVAGAIAAMILGGLCVALGAGCHGTQPVAYHLKVDFTVSDPQFLRTVGQVLGPPLLEGNRIKTLVNGDEIFPAMLAAIGSAKETITMETYTYCAGDVAQKFVEALSERARAGVKVHLLVDWYGSSIWGGGKSTFDEKCYRQLTEAGVEVIQYHRFEPLDIDTWSKVDHRTHRKLLVVDGKIGFIGGVGIADLWMGHAQDPAHWRDTHYRVDGPVVAQLQAAFIEDWMESSGHVLAGESYFPALQPAGTALAQVFKSSTNGGSENMQLMMLLSIAAAGKSIRIESAYFLPNPLTEQYLIEARRRKVRVEIIVPGPHIDETIVRDASRGRWGRLLEAGVEIYEFQPTMLHCKQMIVDDLWVSVGSSNQDNRSFRLNAEANLNVRDADFAAEQNRVFAADKARSKRVTLAEWEKLSPFVWLRNCMANLMRPEL